MLLFLIFFFFKDAILDLARETSQWMAKIQSRAGKLMQYGTAPPQDGNLSSQAGNLTPTRSGRSSPALWLQRQTTKSRRLSRQSSMSNSTAGSLMERYKPKFARSKSKDETIQMHFKAQLKVRIHSTILDPI